MPGAHVKARAGDELLAAPADAEAGPVGSLGPDYPAEVCGGGVAELARAAELEPHAHPGLPGQAQTSRCVL